VAATVSSRRSVPPSDWLTLRTMMDFSDLVYSLTPQDKLIFE